jgi:hypothetical protein
MLGSRPVRRKFALGTRLRRTALTPQDAAKVPLPPGCGGSPRAPENMPSCTCSIFKEQIADHGGHRLPARGWRGHGARLYSNVYHTIFLRRPQSLYWSIFRPGAEFLPQIPSPRVSRCRQRNGGTISQTAVAGEVFRNNRGAVVCLGHFGQHAPGFSRFRHSCSCVYYDILRRAVLVDWRADFQAFSAG